MAITIQRSGIKYGSGGMTGNGVKTLVREIIYSAEENDTEADLLLSPYYPQKGEALPDYPAFTLDSVSAAEWADVPRSCRIEATYKSVEAGTAIGSKGKKPWEIGPQNISQTAFGVVVPLTQVYNRAGELVPFVNYAGLPFKGTTEITGVQLEFTQTFEYKGRFHARNKKLEYNADAVVLFGETIPPYCGKLMPTTSELHSVYGDDGKLQYEYETLRYCVQIFWGQKLKDADGQEQYAGWFQRVLQVSTLFKDQSGNLSAIWKYIPFTSADPVQQARTEPEFGTISNVIVANNKFHKLTGDATSNIPFEEFTEPMPLRPDGNLSLLSIADPVNYPYHEFEYIESLGTNWQAYDLPKTTEG